MKNKQGITLIALAITIIVMLILVGVTINVALNGGLFTKAKYASEQTEEKAILEKIIALATWKDDGTIDVTETITEVEKEFNFVTSNADGTYTIKGKTGEYKYAITKDKIAVASKNSGGEHKLNQYGFYEDVVYVKNIEHVDSSNPDSPNLTEYVYIGKNLSVLKLKAIVGDDDLGSDDLVNPAVQIKSNPVYEIKDGTQEIQGKVMEIDGTPTYLIGEQGKLYSIAIEGKDEIDSITVSDVLVYIPNFELDPDVIFEE